MSETNLDSKSSPPFKGLPSVDRVLHSDLGEHAIARFGQQATVKAIRRVLDRTRAAISDGVATIPTASAVAADVLALLTLVTTELAPGL